MPPLPPPVSSSPHGSSQNWRYEVILRSHSHTLTAIGWKLCCPMPGWSGWDTWHLLHRKTGRLRPAPPPLRLQKILDRIARRLATRRTP